jgi:phage gp29-like protein
VPVDDPAYAQPAAADIIQGRSGAGLIYREIPMVTIQTSWSVSDTRAALASLTSGLFDAPAQLVDAIVGDDRVQATMGSRTGGLLGREVKFIAANDTDEAQACLDAWREQWPTLGTESSMSELQQWAIMMGFGPAQLVWDTSTEMWSPHVRPWHPRYSYYHWSLRRYIAMTLDGQVAIEPGDGHWLLHCPHGEYRGWMRGSVRALAQPWLIRQFGIRDWARWSERHGMPIYLARTPAAGNPVDVAAFAASMRKLGQESVVQLPQGVEKEFSYDLGLLEAKDAGWQGFQQLINQCDMSIVLALLYQNLTTEMKEGSFAAARVHADVRQSALEADARALAHTIYTQIARPFAAYNFGDADLAPRTNWDVTPVEDNLQLATTFDKIGDAIFKMGRGGKGVKDLGELLQRFNVPVRSHDIIDIPPIQGGSMGSGGGQ